ncbi:MAG: RDD family protein [Geobacter sp.]|nr:MAG: RDD family protein [Geobacter sp.]
MSGRRLEGQYAGFLSRAVGLILDYVIIMAVVIGVGLLVTLVFNAFRIDLATCSVSESNIPFGPQVCLAGRWFLGVFAVVFGPLYFLIFWMLTGQTIGQRVMGLRVVRLNGRRMGFWLSLVRWYGYQVCIFTLGIGFLWVLIDNRRMGWHDKLARTCVVYAWKAEQNEAFIAKVNRRFGRRKATSAQVEPISLQDAPTAQEQIAG